MRGRFKLHAPPSPLPRLVRFVHSAASPRWGEANFSSSSCPHFAGIHVLPRVRLKSWMAGSSPPMTNATLRGATGSSLVAGSATNNPVLFAAMDCFAGARNDEYPPSFRSAAHGESGIHNPGTCGYAIPGSSLSPGPGIRSPPKNHARRDVFQKNRAARNIPIHRHKCKAFDFASAMTITRPVSLVKGRRSGRHAVLMGARCGARGGSSLPLPGGSGSPVDRQKDRSARSVLNRGKLFRRSGQNTCCATAAGNPVLELSHRGKSRWRVPQA